MKRFEFGLLASVGNHNLDFKFYVDGDLADVYKQSSVGIALGDLSYVGWEIKSTHHVDSDLYVYLQREIENVE